MENGGGVWAAMPPTHPFYTLLRCTDNSLMTQPVDNQPIQCPQCQAFNPRGAAVCDRCAAPLPHSQPPDAVTRVLLPLPILRGQTWVTWGILGINLLLFLLMRGSTDSSVLLQFGAKYGPAIFAGEYWRLFSAMFLHIGLMHLAFNSYALYALGQEVERFFGRGRFLTLYLLCGLLSVAVSYMASSTLAAGASGAIFGLVGALGAFFLHEKDVFGEIGRRRLNNLISVVLVNLVIGFTVPGIDNWAHLGGLAAGLLLGWILSPTYTVKPPTPTSPAQVVDRNSLTKRWWVLPAALIVLGGLTLVGNLREASTAGGHHQKGEAYLEQGLPEAAIREFTLALESDDDYWPAYLARAEAHLQLFNPEAALNDYDTVIQAQPSDYYLSIAYSGRGWITLLNGDSQGALQDLSQAINQDPNQPFARFARGLIYSDMGRTDLAIQDLELALDLGLEGEWSQEAARQELETLKAQQGEG